MARRRRFKSQSLGCNRTPEEFLALATTLTHPLDSPQAVDQSNLRAIVSIRGWKKSEVVSFRNDALKHYLNLARSLSVEEQSFRAGLDDQVNEVSRG